MNETIICRICLNVIQNFICLDCFKKEFEKFFPEEFLRKFSTFHKNLKKTFSTEENSMFCMKCKKISETAICNYCYNNEVFSWLSSFDERIASNFIKSFNCNFLNDESNVKKWQPIILNEKEKEYDINFCEICGQAGELFEKDGKFVCESCNEEP